MEEDLKSALQQRVETLNEDQLAQFLVSELVKKSKDKTNSLIWQMDVSISVGEMLQYFSGIWIKEDGGVTTVYKSKNPPMNSAGVIKLARILTPLMNKDVISSNLSMKEISMIMQQLIDFELDLAINYKQYGIDPTEFVVLKNSILHPIYANLKRAFEDGTRNWNAKMINVNESVNKNEKERSRGILEEITGRR